VTASIEPVSKRETPPAATKFGTSLCRRLRLEGNEYDLIFKVYLRTALHQQYQILDCPDQRQLLPHDHQPGSFLPRTHSLVHSLKHRLSIVGYKRALVPRCPLEQRGILCSRQSGFLDEGIQQVGNAQLQPTQNALVEVLINEELQHAERGLT